VELSIGCRCTKKNNFGSLLVNKNVTIVINMLNDHKVIADNVVDTQIINSRINGKCKMIYKQGRELNKSS